jgi:hypothetical protein
MVSTSTLSANTNPPLIISRSETKEAKPYKAAIG